MNNIQADDISQHSNKPNGVEMECDGVSIEGEKITSKIV